MPTKKVIFAEALLLSVRDDPEIDGQHFARFKEHIDNAPDAVEVVHGRWIFKHNPITDPKKYFIRIVCSECNLHTGQKSNYCPNCGAKMDGGKNDG